MSLQNHKITQANISERKGLSPTYNAVREELTRLIGTAEENKSVFDRMPSLIIEHLNDLIDSLDEQTIIDANNAHVWYDEDYDSTGALIISPQTKEDFEDAVTATYAVFRTGSNSGEFSILSPNGNSFFKTSYPLLSVAEGYRTTASGDYSHAEGGGTIARGRYSHTEGSYTTVSGEASHAEGGFTEASGDFSHAEGNSTEAIGDYSHVEGFVTKASGNYSHAQNENTVAAKKAQTALGRYNIEDINSGDYGKYAVMVGNGSYGERSNAFTVDWEGNIEASGDVTDGSGNKLSDIPTKTSDLTNDSNFVSDASYVHTDNNYTTSEKTKLANIPVDAEKNVQSDWNQTTTTADDFIKNKPAIKSGSGAHSIVEGNSSTTASGNYSHAEGYDTTAYGDFSHTEGNGTITRSYASHAEGIGTTASGFASHAQNEYTLASKKAQTALGTYNVEDTNSGDYGKYAVIVGNGTAVDNRSNALMVDWEGNVEASGDIEDGSGNVLSQKADPSDIPTKTSDLTNDSNFVSDASYVHTDNNYTTSEKTKLANIPVDAEKNVQSDWNQVDATADDYIKNKPTIPTKTSDLINDSNFVSDASYVHTDNNYTTAEKNKLAGIEAGAEKNQVITVTQHQLSGIHIADIDIDGATTEIYAPSGGGGGGVQSDWSQTDPTQDDYIKNKPSIPTKTSDLTNDSNYVSDASYVHTDSNYTASEKSKLAGIEAGAEENVQSNWNQTDSTADDYIKNKPTIPTKTSDLTNDSNFVSDASYVHTDNNYTASEKRKLEGIETGAEINVQSNWNQMDSTEDDYIKNKPSINRGSNYFAIEEGLGTTASGDYSHAEGSYTTASGEASHAEGSYTTARGDYSHVEGYRTTASGNYSHAQNERTIASKQAQTALGRYNIEDTNSGDYGKYAVIVGNGSYGKRSNAFSVDWGGNIRMALDTTASAGTVDGDLYRAITALGWEGDVIENA